MKFKKIVHYILVLLLAVGLTACSDNGSDSGSENQPPEIPALAEKAQPDRSFFENNNSGPASNFNSAKNFVIINSALIFSNATFLGFINPATAVDPEFDNGRWVWEYSASAGGASASARTTAEPQGGGFKWTTVISFNDGQGNGVTDLKIMEGTTRNDCAQGDFTFFNINDENNSVVQATSSWTITSDTERTNEAEVFNEEGETILTLNYQQNGAENLMSAVDPDPQDSDTEAFWNTETNIGFINQNTDESTEKGCWDESLQDAACSEVGL